MIYNWLNTSQPFSIENINNNINTVSNSQFELKREKRNNISKMGNTHKIHEIQ